ncbi:ABC transporter ATP-binding protein [Halovivax cerinus]|uniref:Nickel import system ATP-binding protein NikD n=1 Tax=Halovivax cerinus TaxID=1487865 RepID=A0ABD5NUC1_9EURY|nr:ABC transporter ATP-binding protein [Halovivax cerinus]
MSEQPLLSVDNLTVEFDTEAGIVRAVDDVSFDIHGGEIVGLVGESGAGKSVTGRSLLRLVESPGAIVGGTVTFRGQTIVDGDNPENSMSMDRLRSEIRGQEISLIFQDPMESLNPVFTVGAQMREIIESNRDVDGQAARTAAIEMLHEVGIPDPESRYDEYPHEFSGGMRQRVLIAMALACEPRLIVADEPTTALDVTVEGQILRMVQELQDKYDTSFVWITHDMGVVAELCDRVNVMYLGEVVEQAGVRDLFRDPAHPYTEALLSSIPRPDRDVELLQTIAGRMPNGLDPPEGCRFHPRCPDARDVCQTVRPDPRLVDGTAGERDSARRAACVKHDAFDVGYDTSSPLDTEATRLADETEVTVPDES